jgi:hypothetical protein
MPEKVKKKLDEIGRYVAEKKRKKDVPYGEIVSFLIEQFEVHKDKSKNNERIVEKEKIPNK